MSVAAVEQVRSESPVRRFMARFLRQPAGNVALIYLMVLFAALILAPYLAPYSPNPAVPPLLERLRGPSIAHWLGQDELGRDVLSRMFYAGRTSMLAAFQAVALAAVIGIPAGLIAGYLRGVIDVLMSRFADALLSIPSLILALAIIGVLGPNLTNAMIALGLVYAPRIFRLVRSVALSVREEAFVEAARAVGSPTHRILIGHVLPNVASPIIVQISLLLGFAILAEAALSFLGLGEQPPGVSWGTMLGNSARFIEQAPFASVVPGVAIMLTSLAFNMLGDAIRDSIGRE